MKISWKFERTFLPLVKLKNQSYGKNVYVKSK